MSELSKAASQTRANFIFSLLSIMNIVLRCPQTCLNAQHGLHGRESESWSEYDGIVCQACSKINVLNRKIGELLGKQDE